MKRVRLFSGLLGIAIGVQAQSHFSDCSSAYIACSRESIVITQMPDPGLTGEIADVSCFNGVFPETNNVWIKWKINKPGSLGFTITPLEEADDIDFILFRLEEEIENCLLKTEMRCMASGGNRGEVEGKSPGQCSGATGLREIAEDTGEFPGCSKKDDNYLASLTVREGEVFALFINNYYSTGGFLLEFSGTAEFEKLKGLCTEPSSDIIFGQLNEEGVLIGVPFPNPAQTELYLPLTSSYEAGPCLIRIMDAFGTIARQQTVSISAGEQLLEFSLEGLPTGVYFLKTTIGDRQHIIRFYKH